MLGRVLVLDETRDSVEEALREIEIMRQGDECVLSHHLYSDMNGIPHDTDSCLKWVQTNLENALKEME